jgi:hypothetical protein
LCHIFGSSSQSKSVKDGCRFICAAYVDVGDERLEAVGDFSQCPCAEDDNPCPIKKHSYRTRKMGPRIPVRVFYCHTHQRYFTVYPMGHIPYGRKSLVPLDPSGWPRDGKESSIAHQWKKTCFVAALEAAEGQLWLKEVVRGDPAVPRYGTQERWIKLSGGLLGLSPDVPEQAAEKVALELQIPAGEHRQARSDFQQARTLCGRGRAVRGVVGFLRVDQPMWSRFLRAGCLAGVWKRAVIWERSMSDGMCSSSPKEQASRAPPQPMKRSLPDAEKRV